LRTLGCQTRIGLCKSGFNERHIRAANKPTDRVSIGMRVRKIDHAADFCPGATVTAERRYRGVIVRSFTTPLHGSL